MEKIKRGCIENGIQLVDTPTMHLGTDGSRKLYTQLIDYLIEKGVEFATEREIESLIIEDKTIKGVAVTHKGKKRRVLFRSCSHWNGKKWCPKDDGSLQRA